MKHISEILPNVINKIKLNKKICCKCNADITGIRRKYCSPCSEVVKKNAQQQFVKKAGEIIDTECIDCCTPIKSTRGHSKNARCAPCKLIMQRKHREAYSASLKRSSVDPLGDVLKKGKFQYDDYNIPTTNDFIVRC